MKKTIALALALMLSLMLFACKAETPSNANTGGSQTPATSTTEQQPAAATEQTAFELYKKAVVEMEAAESLTSNIVFKMDMGAGGSNLTMDMSGLVVQKNLSSKPEMYMEIQTSTMGQTIDLQAWYKDGYYYYSTMGTQVKTPMSVEQAKSQNNASILSFTEAAIKDQKVTDSAGGGKELQFSIDGSKMADLVKQALAGSGSAGADASGANITWDDVKINMVIDKDGKVTSYSCIMSFSMDVAGAGTATYSMNISMTNIDYAPVTIEFPSELDSFQELGV